MEASNRKFGDMTGYVLVDEILSWRFRIRASFLFVAVLKRVILILNGDAFKMEGEACVQPKMLMVRSWPSSAPVLSIEDRKGRKTATCHEGPEPKCTVSHAFFRLARATLKTIRPASN